MPLEQGQRVLVKLEVQTVDDRDKTVLVKTKGDRLFRNIWISEDEIE